MDDLISRQEAIEALCSVCGYDCDKSEFIYDAPQDEQVILCPEHYALTQLPSVQPKQRWIPVSERMPEPRIDVWCNSDMGQMVGYYEENVETWYGRDYLELMVTAWMPLPEPYKDAQ